MLDMALSTTVTLDDVESVHLLVSCQNDIPLAGLDYLKKCRESQDRNLRLFFHCFGCIEVIESAVSIVYLYS